MGSRRNFSAMWGFLLLFMSWVGYVGAADLPGASRELTDSVEKLAAALNQNGQVPPEVTAALRDLTSAVQHLAEAVQGQPAVTLAQATIKESELPKSKIEALTEQFESLTAKIRPYGDFRLREEKDTHRDSSEERNRARTRFRLGADYRLTEELAFGARLSTGDPSDAQSPHQNLGGGHNVGGNRGVFGRYDFNLDRAFLTYRPAWLQGFWVTAGKFAHPFKKPAIFSELVWDDDVQAEGITVGYTLRNLGHFKAFIDSLDLVAGEYLLLEQANSDIDAQVYQMAANKKFGDRWSVTAAAGFYNFGNPEKNRSNVIVRNHNAGNATLDLNRDGLPDAFDSDFQILDTFFNLEYSGWKVPLTLVGQHFSNLGSDVRGRGDGGFAAGLAVGKLTAPRSWQVYYQYQQIEQDAVFTPLSQDDWMVQTNFRGHVSGIKYRLFNKVDLHLWGLLHRTEDPSRPRRSGSTSDSEKTQSRFRVDVNVAF